MARPGSLEERDFVKTGKGWYKNGRRYSAEHRCAFCAAPWPFARDDETLLARCDECKGRDREAVQ